MGYHDSMTDNPISGYVYRFRDPASAEVLYIGSTNDVASRVSAHRNAPWWSDRLDVVVDEHPSMRDARRAEKHAIRSEHPTHNIAYKRLRRDCPCPSCRRATDWHRRLMEATA